ncbi:MAG: TRAP transporter substrate-binding protein DctP [Synergistaceae bacterium]|nr:TRAP transporter substrate-binding protein DctP [Synergistaceae bacterium]
MRKICLAVTVLLSVIFCAGVSMAALKAEYKLSCNLADNNPWGQGAAMFVKLVAERTGGKVNIKPYWSAQLLGGNQSSELMLIRNGTIDFSFAGPANWAAQLPVVNVANLPWFVSSQKDRFKAYDALFINPDSKVRKMLEEKFAEVGVVTLAWGENGFRELHSNRPIRKPEDLKGLKIRVVATPIWAETLTTLGANAININWTEAVSAFQQGLVDAGENPYSVLIPYHIYEFHKYFINWSWVAGPLAFVASKQAWGAFDDDTKKILIECAEEAATYNRALARMGIDGGWGYSYLKERNLLPEDQNAMPYDPYKLLKDNGVTIIELTPEEFQAFRDAVKPIYEKHVKLIGEELVKAAEEEMAKVQ